jgi:hypothetical protein
MRRRMIEMFEMFEAGFTSLEILVLWSSQGADLTEEDRLLLQQLPHGAKESFLHAAHRKRDK